MQESGSNWRSSGSCREETSSLLKGFVYAKNLHKFKVTYSGWVFISLTRWVLLTVEQLHSVLCWRLGRNVMCSLLIGVPWDTYLQSLPYTGLGRGAFSWATALALMLCSCWCVTVSQTGLLGGLGAHFCSSLRLFWCFCFTLKGECRRINRFCVFALYNSSMSKMYQIWCCYYDLGVSNLNS